MKKILITLVLGLGLQTANAQIEKLAGPRIGFTLHHSMVPISRFYYMIEF